MLFLKGRGRTASSHVHVWVGRALITLGAINGGLGLLLLTGTPYAAEDRDYVIYGVITAVVWLVYVAVAVVSEVKRARGAAAEENAQEVVVHMGEKKMVRHDSDDSADSPITLAEDDEDVETLAKSKEQLVSDDMLVR